jgi:hypothetical protein
MNQQIDEAGRILKVDCDKVRTLWLVFVSKSVSDIIENIFFFLAPVRPR